MPCAYRRHFSISQSYHAACLFPVHFWVFLCPSPAQGSEDPPLFEDALCQFVSGHVDSPLLCCAVLLTVSLLIRIINWDSVEPLGWIKGQEQGLKCRLSLKMKLVTYLDPCPCNPQVVWTHLTCVHRHDYRPWLQHALLLYLALVSCDLVSLGFGNKVGKHNYHRILEDGKADWLRDWTPRNRTVRRGC